MDIHITVDQLVGILAQSVAMSIKKLQCPICDLLWFAHTSTDTIVCPRCAKKEDVREFVLQFSDN